MINPTTTIFISSTVNSGVVKITQFRSKMREYSDYIHCSSQRPCSAPVWCPAVWLGLVELSPVAFGDSSHDLSDSGQLGPLS